MKLTLKNDFHNTEAVLIVKDRLASMRAVKQAARKLCGNPECKCGSHVRVYNDGKQILLIPSSGGNWEVDGVQ